MNQPISDLIGVFISAFGSIITAFITSIVQPLFESLASVFGIAA